MTAATNGTVGVSITAGHIHATSQPPHPRIGQQVQMGDDAAFMMHITPVVARQWIQVLNEIANEKSTSA